MGVLDEIMQMKNQGKTDEEIINSLRQKRVSPKEINDAISQAQIKKAVSSTSGSEGMQRSIMQKENADSDVYTPRSQEVDKQDEYTPQPQEAYQQEYPQEYYSPRTSEQYYQTEGYSSDTMMEIAEQVFSKKIKKTEKQVDDLNEFKALAQTKINNAVERLQRIESTIDKLQMAILDKIGSYGDNLQNIKKEMSMMQDSFGKMINNVADRTTQPVAFKKFPANTSKKKDIKKR